MTFVGSPGNAESGATDPVPGPGTAPEGLAPGVAPFMVRSSKRTRILVAGAATAALGAACLYTALVDPNNPSNAFPQCPLKALTGIDCPGCGGLRATHAIFRGDILGAADHNVLALVLLPVMAYMFVRWVLLQFEVTLPRVSWPRAFMWITPVVLVLFTVARNIPVPGLHWLNSGLN